MGHEAAPPAIKVLATDLNEAALARATACYLALNCLGSLIGPVVTGVVMDYFGKAALPISGIAACGRGSRQARRRDRHRCGNANRHARHHKLDAPAAHRRVTGTK